MARLSNNWIIEDLARWLEDNDKQAEWLEIDDDEQEEDE